MYETEKTWEAFKPCHCGIKVFLWPRFLAGNVCRVKPFR